MTTQFPDPWLADTEWLLSELAKTREQILRIPFRLDTQSDIESATGRIFNLEERIRYMVALQREAQRSFAKQADAAAQEQKPHGRKAKSTIIRLRA